MSDKDSGSNFYIVWGIALTLALTWFIGWVYVIGHFIIKYW